MHASRAPINLDQTSFSRPLPLAIPAEERRDRYDVNRRGSLRRRSHRLSAVAILFAVALALAAFGVATDNGVAAAYGLGASAPAAFAVAIVGWTSIRRLERRCVVLGRARVESERARHDLELVNAKLRQRVEQLEAREAAVDDGFDWVDEQTAGRLRALLDQAGLELADLAYLELDDEEAQP